jgi:type II secretory pathway pseudopilin PulG
MTSFRGSKSQTGGWRLAAGGRKAGRSAGFTMAELLTVMAIITLIGGLSAGAYQVARRNHAFTASAGNIQRLIRSARNTSLSTGTPSLVTVDPVARTVSAHAFEWVGEWGFDGPEGGTPLSPDRSVVHEAATCSGVLGTGLDFSGGTAHVDCGNEPRFDLKAAVAIEAWVRHASVPSPKPPAAERQAEKRAAKRAGAAPAETARAIVEKQGSYFLGMTESGALEGRIGEHVARTAPGAVVPGRWVRVSLRFDGKALELAADGIPRGTAGVAGGGARKPPAAKAQGVPLPAEAPISSSPLTISSPRASFPGAIDEVRLGGATEPITYTYPEHEHIIGWKKLIHFDGQGRLDAARHDGGVRLVLVEIPEEERTAAKTVVHVDYSLTFDEWLARYQRPSDVRQSVEEARLEAQFTGARKIEILVDRLGVVK